VHIDFGFFLSNAPGGKLKFEKSIPFKLLNDHISVLGG
jgi:phosphatidylinositol 4-kinase